jgi:hypothetical protein
MCTPLTVQDRFLVPIWLTHTAMSTRHVRRLLEQKQNIKQSEKEEEDEEEQEEDDGDAQAPAPFNPFDLLSDEDEVSDWRR